MLFFLGNPKSCTEFRTNSSRDFNSTARGPSGCWVSGHSKEAFEGWRTFWCSRNTSNVFEEKAGAPHSSALAWKIPRTEEPGGLRSMGSLRVRHGWAPSRSLCTGDGNGSPPQCSRLESARDGEPGGCRLWGRTGSDTTEATSQLQQQRLWRPRFLRNSVTGFRSTGSSWSSWRHLLCTRRPKP